jgi:hypothetical protein
MTDGQKCFFVTVVLGLAARGATSPVSQQLTSAEEEEMLANLKLDLGILILTIFNLNIKNTI